jgi:hypothetical protein
VAIPLASTASGACDLAPGPAGATAEIGTAFSIVLVGNRIAEFAHQFSLVYAGSCASRSSEYA